MSITVPSLSLLDYTNGDPRKRLQFLLNLEEALHNIGFVRFRDHGVDNSLFSEFYRLLRVFFVDWTEEQRMEMEQRRNGRQRGYGPFGCEHAAGTDPYTAFDTKMMYSMGVATHPGHPRFTEIAPNVYPNIPGFRRVNDEVYAQLMRVMRIIFAAVSEILGEGPDWLPKHCESGDSMMRGLYYPGKEQMPQVAKDRARCLRAQCKADGVNLDDPTQNELKILIELLEQGIVPPGCAGSHGHADIDVGTIIPRALVKGLWAKARTGETVEIHGESGEILYQNGDTSEAISGGYLLSAIHGVINETERINAVLFGHADRAFWVDIVKKMLTHATKSVNPMTERRALGLRLHEIGHTDFPLPER